MAEDVLHVDLEPVKSFRYYQIDNYKFNYLLLNEEFKALHTPFECKDYLDDMFWCEYTGNNADIYGIHWEKGMINLNVDFFNLAMLGGGFKMSKIREELQELLNIFEDAQGFKRSEVLETDNDEIVVIKFSKEWTSSGPLLSAFTSIIRLSGVYKLGQNVLSYLKNLYKSRNRVQKIPDWMYVEVSRLENTLFKLAALLQGKKVEFNWESITNIMDCHETGICEFEDFPTVEVKI